MKSWYGLAVYFNEEDGTISRTMFKENGRIEMKDTSITDALIHFTELDLREYATIVDAVDDMFRHTYDISKPKENVTIQFFIKKEFDEALNIVSILIQQFEKDDPFYGTLTRFAVDDELLSKHKPTENEGLTMNTLSWIFRSVIYMQFLVNDAIWRYGRKKTS